LDKERGEFNCNEFRGKPRTVAERRVGKRKTRSMLLRAKEEASITLEKNCVLLWGKRKCAGNNLGGGGPLGKGVKFRERG